jgi:N-methylhydantoinase B/oxoprolinase/acetone carboxylase alpha subunit
MPVSADARGKETIVVPPGEAIVLELPGGGGYGKTK